MSKCKLYAVLFVVFVVFHMLFCDLNCTTWRIHDTSARMYATTRYMKTIIAMCMHVYMCVWYVFCAIHICSGVILPLSSCQIFLYAFFDGVMELILEWSRITFVQWHAFVIRGLFYCYFIEYSTFFVFCLLPKLLSGSHRHNAPHYKAMKSKWSV